MMVARLLWPWEVLDMDLQDMKQVSSAGNRNLPVKVDRACRFLFYVPARAQGIRVRGAETPETAVSVRHATVDREWNRGGGITPKVPTCASD